MTDTTVTPTGFTFPGPEHRAVFLGLRIAQTIALGAGVLWAVAAMVMIPSGLGLLIGAVFALLGAAVAFVRVSGRHLDEWAPVIGRWTIRRGERTWVSPIPLWGEADNDGGGRAAPPRRCEG